MKRLAIAIAVAIALPASALADGVEKKSQQKATQKAVSPPARETFETAKEVQRSVETIESNTKMSTMQKQAMKDLLLGSLNSCARQATLNQISIQQRDKWIGACVEERLYQANQRLEEVVRQQQAEFDAGLEQMKREDRRQEQEFRNQMTIMLMQQKLGR